MADTDGTSAASDLPDDGPRSEPLSPREHIALAAAHHEAAQAHLGDAITHLKAHPSYPDAPADGGQDDAPSDESGGQGSDGTSDGGRSFPGSAQSKAGFRAGTGAAASFRSLTGRR